MKQDFQKQYNSVINLVGHLMLTKPDAVIRLLAKYGVIFKGTPQQKQLTYEVVQMFHRGHQGFVNDLEKVLNLHIQAKGNEMAQLEQMGFSTYVDFDNEDAFWGKIAKGALKMVGKVFKKKRKGRSSRGSSSSSSAAATKVALAQAAQMRKDFERQMKEMEERRKEAERERKEAIERRRKEEEAKKKQTFIIGVAVAGTMLIGGFIFIAGRRPQQPMMNYMPPQMMQR